MKKFSNGHEDRTGIRPITFAFMLFFAVIVVMFLFGLEGSPQWIMLAQSFLAGKVSFLQAPSVITDAVFWHGSYYWPFPPAPALFLVPFVAIGWLLKIPLSQGFFQFLLVVGLFWLIYKFARTYCSSDDAAWWVIAFIFASAFLWIAPIPAYTHLSYVFSVLALFGALYEYVGKKRWWLIGVLMGIALASRTAAGLGICFFLGDILFISKRSVKEKLKEAAVLLAPFLATGIMLAFYNYVRFGSPFETGYALQILTADAYVKARSYGVFSLAHVPGNLYYFLFNGPLPILKDGVSRVLAFPYIAADPWGMGLVFVSPYLFYLFLLSYKDTISRLLIATSVLIAIPVFLYYGIGFTQLGYRYGLDFMPFIYFLFIKNYSEQYGALSTRFKWLIALSALFDLYLFFTLVFIPMYP